MNENNLYNEECFWVSSVTDTVNYNYNTYNKYRCLFNKGIVLDNDMETCVKMNTDPFLKE